MSETNQYIAEFERELKFYSDYLEEVGFDHEINMPTELKHMPVLSVLLDEDEDEEKELPLTIHYMFVEPEDEEDDEDDEDIFGHTNYLQALVGFPMEAKGEESFLDLILFCSIINQQLPLGMLYVSAEGIVMLRHVFPIDREVGLTREVFLETFYVLAFLAGQVENAVRPLAAGECSVDEAVERYGMPE